jgi:hypothetical protein
VGSLLVAPATRSIGAPRPSWVQRAPKQIWILPEARHQDFHRLEPAEYERRVALFFASMLSRP